MCRKINLTNGGLKMSKEINDQYLEHKYEEGLDMGMSEEEAANYARECLEQDSAPLYDDHSEA